MAFTRKERLGLIIGSIIGAGLIAWLSWTWDRSGAEAAISRIAIVVAAIAVLASLLALKWARDTVRPFICFTGQIGVGGQDYERYIALEVRNTGMLPASKVLVKVTSFALDEVITATSTGRKYKWPERNGTRITIFPNQTWQSVQNFSLKDSGDKHTWENVIAGKVKVRVRISYSCFDRQYETIQSMHIDQYDEMRKKLWGYPADLQSWS